MLKTHGFSALLRRMAVRADAFSGLWSWFGEQPEAVSSSFDEARFDAPGPQPDAGLGHEH